MDTASSVADLVSGACSIRYPAQYLSSFIVQWMCADHHYGKTQAAESSSSGSVGKVVARTTLVAPLTGSERNVSRGLRHSVVSTVRLCSGTSLLTSEPFSALTSPSPLPVRNHNIWEMKSYSYRKRLLILDNQSWVNLGWGIETFY